VATNALYKALKIFVARKVRYGTKVRFRVLQETQDKSYRRRREVIGETTDPEVVESLLA
jgi:hypothetical protein